MQHTGFLIVLGGLVRAYDEKKYSFLEDDLVIVRQRLDRPISSVVTVS